MCWYCTQMWATIVLWLAVLTMRQAWARPSTSPRRRRRRLLATPAVPPPLLEVSQFFRTSCGSRVVPQLSKRDRGMDSTPETCRPGKLSYSEYPLRVTSFVTHGKHYGASKTVAFTTTHCDSNSTPQHTSLSRYSKPKTEGNQTPIFCFSSSYLT